MFHPNLTNHLPRLLIVAAFVIFLLTASALVPVRSSRATQAGATLQFSTPSYLAGEAGGSAIITVTRSGATTGAVTVDYATSDGSASERSDYTTALGKLRFAAGETSKTFPVLITDDLSVEGNETVNLTLSNPTGGATLGSQSTAVLTLNDNDLVPSSVNPIDQSPFYVRQQYLDFLNREPDSSGFAFWQNEIEVCGADVACREVKRINTSAAFYLSIEFQNTGYLVERVYKASYGSANGASTFSGTHQLPVPIVRFKEFLLDTQEIGRGVVVLQPGWEAVLENNKQAFAADFVQRSRFTTAFPSSMTAAQFVDTLNLNAGNPLSQSERDQLVNDLSTNARTRAQVLRAVAEDPDLVSAEFNRAFVLMQYFGYLRRNPDDPQDTDHTGYDFWLTKLNQFNGNFGQAEMVKAFLSSIEYRARFVQSAPSNQPPSVNAGADQAFALPNTTNLSGTVTDDGLPSGSSLFVSWSKVSGPGSIIFGSANSAFTNAIFNTPGTYILRLAASDGQLAASDDVTVIINPDPVPPPPDPSTVAPPLDTTVATTVFSGTGFLYDGPNPIQTGVAPGTINPVRVAILRGKVTDRNNAPLPKVKVTILNHPEFGQTLTRADGMFDIAVNGGGLLTIKFEKVGFLPVQRTENVPWQDYEGVPDVVMIGYDPAVTFIDLNAATPIQVVHGSVVSDSSGTRRARLFFKQGTTATIKLPGGAMQGLDKFNMRATEYTVGPNGPQTMPGDLPPTSDYTYAVKFSIDEAEAAGAVEESFSQPVIQYLENFLNFPTGTLVPSGFYDSLRGVWVPSANGRVVKILSITGGTANLDVNGAGVAATDPEYAALGINVPERQTLATLFAANQSLWRVPFSRFSPIDLNFPGGDRGRVGSTPNGGATGIGGNPPNNQNRRCGSVIGCQGQTLGETINPVGAPFTLNYSSDRTPGRQTEYTVNIPLSGATVPAPLQRIDLEVNVAGQVFRQSFPPAPNQTTTFTWDGKDAYGRSVQGKQMATVTIGFVYNGVYYNTVGFGFAANGIPLVANPTRNETSLLRRTQLAIGAFDAHGQGLGGWSLDVHHVYDPISRTLYTGDGGRRRVESVNRVITTAAGTGAQGYSGDGGQATAAAFTFPEGLDVAPDGSAYVADVGNRVVRRIATNGIVTKVAGTVAVSCTPATDPCGDGGQASAARFNAPVTVAFAPDGSYYVLDPGAHKVRKVEPNGVISTVIGTGVVCPLPTDACGDGGPATQAKINNSQGLFVAPDGTIFLADTSNRRIRRIGTDGIISTIAGNGNAGGCPVDNFPATQACLGGVFGVVLGPDGSLYFTENQFHRVYRMGVDGILHVIAGNGSCGSGGDGGPATAAQLCNPEGITRGPDGSIYIADWANGRIRKIDADGIINTVAGNGVPGFSGDGGAATAAMIRQSTEVKLGPDGSIWIADLNNHRVRRVNPPLPGFTNTDIAIPSEDGNELYQFNGEGRHLRTKNTLTGATKYAFNYDSAGRLTNVIDGDNNTTTIQRNGAGSPTGILSPDNQLTTLMLNTGGYINKITDPASQMHQFVYSANGLMTQYTTPRNHVFTYTYDALGRLIRNDDPATGFKTLARTDAGLTYNVLLTTALNRTTNYQVNQLANGDQQRITILPNGLQTSLLERPNATSTSTTVDGTVTNETLGPDPRWRMQAPLPTLSNTTTPGALTLSTTFSRAVTLSNPLDPLSLVTLNDTFSVNGRNHTSNFTAATRTFVDTTPVGRQTTTIIDAQNRPTQQQFANLDPASFSYDARGRLSTATLSSGVNARVFSFAYNANGFLSSLTDALNRVTSLSYDNAGRVTQQTLPDSRVIGFGYDANGNPTSLTPPGRPAHTLAYNSVDLLTSYTPPTVPGTGATQFAYNVDRQLITVTRPDALTLNFAYDSAGRLQTLTVPHGAYGLSYSGTTGKLSSVTAPGGGSLNFAYDGALVTGTTWAGAVAGSVTRAFDNNFRVTSQSVNGASTVDFAYDNDSLLTAAGSLTLTRNAQNGLVTGTTLGNVADTIGYNNFAEPINYTASFNSTNLYGVQFTRDKLGRITQKNETISGTTTIYAYSYDQAGRLATVTLNGAGTPFVTYSYDSNSNRLSAAYGGPPITATYDAQDRLTQYGVFTYAYTANGELQSRTMGAQTTQYSYDVLGNLKSVTLPGGPQIDYVIDGRNRRIGKQVNGTLTQGFLYGDQLRIVAELDGSNNLVSRFVYGSGQANVPDYMVKNAVTYRLIADHLGSIRLVVDTTSGAIAQRLDYDEFGVVLTDTNPGFQPFGFAGGLYDSQTGLLRFGARDYDAQTGRWTVKDPLGLDEDETNLYAYVGNDPVNAVDAEGLKKVPVVFKHPGHWEWRLVDQEITITECVDGKMRTRRVKTGRQVLDHVWVPDRDEVIWLEDGEPSYTPPRDNNDSGLRAPFRNPDYANGRNRNSTNLIHGLGNRFGIGGFNSSNAR
jgi:RHS repeat-associated protein